MFLFKVQTSPVEIQTKLDLDTEILARQSEAARALATKKVDDDEERANLLLKQDRS